MKSAKLLACAIIGAEIMLASSFVVAGPQMHGTVVAEKTEVREQ